MSENEQNYDSYKEMTAAIGNKTAVYANWEDARCGVLVFRAGTLHSTTDTVSTYRHVPEAAAREHRATLIASVWYDNHTVKWVYSVNKVVNKRVNWRANKRAKL